MPTKPRVVITGAAGFIGSHLAETLLDRDYSIIGIDNLLTGDTANISHLANRDFAFIKHDVTNYIYIDGPVDYVLHWASPASPIDYLELPIPTLKVGALGTHNALGLARATGATFIREVLTGVYESDIGVIAPSLGDLASYREAIGASDVALFGNITPEFSSTLGTRTTLHASGSPRR